jgi:hypothetical protein
MINRATVNIWVLGVLVFFTLDALQDQIHGDALGYVTGVAIAVYVLVALWTFDVSLPIRRRPEKPHSAVRARVEAARQRSQS